jgi:predicted DNA-binding protein
MPKPKKRTTVVLPEELERRAFSYSAAQGRPFAFVVREALIAYLDSDAAAAARDPLFADDAVHRDGGRRDTAAGHDRELYGK